MRLDRLAILLCWLLALSGAAYSSGAAWVSWIEAHYSNPSQLHQILPLAERLGMPVANLRFTLSELDPDQEQEHLRAALAADPRHLRAALKLALIEEFAGHRESARQRIEQAVAYHRNYEAFSAALAQAGRWKQADRLAALTPTAIALCPRDLDGIWTQLADPALAERILSGPLERHRADYFRFLIGQQRVAEAEAFEPGVASGEPADRYRLQLVEQLFWKGRREQAARIFARLHPEFSSQGIYNEKLQSQPTSMGFDWRMGRHEKTRLTWRPGEIEVVTEDLAQPVELLSIIAEKRGTVVPLWVGETEGLRLTAEPLDQRYQRVAIIAPAGSARRFQLKEVQFQ